MAAGALLVALGLLSTTTVAAIEPNDPGYFDLIPGTVAEDHVTGDLTTYPIGTGDIPAGCDADRDEIMIGERYLAASEPTRWETDFRRIHMVYDDIVVIEWDSLAPGCEDARVSLSSKASKSTQFNMDDDQWGINSVSCNGVGFPSCEDIGNRLVLPVSLQGVMKCFQIDAHLGRQLLSIGPAGNYYSFLNRNHNVLIGAKNGGVTPCDDTTELREDFPVIATDPCPYAVPEDELPEGSKQCRNVLAPDDPTTTDESTTTSTTAPSNNTLEAPPTTTTPSTTAPPADPPTTEPIQPPATPTTSAPPTTEVPQPVRPAPPTTVCPEPPLTHEGVGGGTGFAGPSFFSAQLLAALFRADDCPDATVPPAPPTTAPPTSPGLDVTTTAPMNNTLAAPPTTAAEPNDPPVDGPPPGLMLPRTGSQHDIAAEFGLSMMLIGAALLLFGLSLQGDRRTPSSEVGSEIN